MWSSFGFFFCMWLAYWIACFAVWLMLVAVTSAGSVLIVRLARWRAGQRTSHKTQDK